MRRELSVLETDLFALLLISILAASTLLRFTDGEKEPLPEGCFVPPLSVFFDSVLWESSSSPDFMERPISKQETTSSFSWTSWTFEPRNVAENSKDV
jgi:hypothetical protein